MPFKINRLTENVNPIKLLEYLAAGLSVVSTPLAEAQAYAQVVRFGETAAEFLTALDEFVKARKESFIRACQEAVRKETWLDKSGAEFRARASSLTLAKLCLGEAQMFSCSLPSCLISSRAPKAPHQGTLIVTFCGIAGDVMSPPPVPASAAFKATKFTP